MSLTWKSSFTGSECRIFRGKVIAGILKVSIWKSEGYGELNGHLLRFRPKGFLKNNITLLDIEGKKELGQISINYWKRSAVIVYNDISFSLKYTSWFRQRWTVTSGEDAAVFEQSLFGKNGSIEEDYITPAVILSALYVNVIFGKTVAATS